MKTFLYSLDVVVQHNLLDVLIFSGLLCFQKANKNRAAVPWVITMGHRPMYCSNKDGDDCTHFESIVSI